MHQQPVLRRRDAGRALPRGADLQPGDPAADQQRGELLEQPGADAAAPVVRVDVHLEDDGGIGTDPGRGVRPADGGVQRWGDEDVSDDGVADPGRHAAEPPGVSGGVHPGLPAPRRDPVRQGAVGADHREPGHPTGLQRLDPQLFTAGHAHILFPRTARTI
ncbi:hypothetical protein SDC9_164408 [bioreactor metagenome]|uniref:Uncharacterized protein n=1 Tax=bioreactor metagenome TaxID=1076179 RepID=A0A645FU86_9ZZZZ